MNIPTINYPAISLLPFVRRKRKWYSKKKMSKNSISVHFLFFFKNFLKFNNQLFRSKFYTQAEESLIFKGKNIWHQNLARKSQFLQFPKGKKITISYVKEVEISTFEKLCATTSSIFSTILFERNNRIIDNRIIFSIFWKEISKRKRREKENGTLGQSCAPNCQPVCHHEEKLVQCNALPRYNRFPLFLSACKEKGLIRSMIVKGKYEE